ncbi:cupin domain-containing protein [Paenibacillaceae bacterium]|nr:cupin domain-containing protein [Paenibacillaceae bacterium]
MRLVLLSGGSGKRLWPLSNDSRSKQFLKMLQRPDGQAESMVQRVWRQIAAAGLATRAYVATSKAQTEMLWSQLGNDVPLIIEPQRRDTFPAIALAAAYLYAMEGASLNETIVVMPVDPYVEEPFFHNLLQLGQVLEEAEADIALVGVEPTSPSDKYGYIVPDLQLPSQNGLAYQMVARFQEKPREEEAAVLIEQAALWNCGVFAFKLDYLINLLMEMGLPIQYEELVKQYARLPKNSFDYEVVERARRVAVMPYSGQWNDLGTWNTLTTMMKDPVIGRGILSGNSQDSHLINELDIPIVVMGLSNIIVAAGPDGILVSDKAASTGIKQAIGQFEDRPMFEERRWGYYRVIDYVKYAAGNEVLTKRICIRKGRNLSYQYHEKRSEVWTIVAGSGEAIINERLQRVAPGDVLLIEKGCRHSVRADEDLEIIEVQTGSELVEEDIIRSYMDWNEMIQICV